MFGNTGAFGTPSNNTGGGTGIFANQGQQSTNPFSNTANTNAGTGNLFAANTPAQGGTVFGNNNPTGTAFGTTNTGNVFGGNNATGNTFGNNTQGNMFGGAGTGIFGANNQQQQQQGTGNVFGQNQPTQANMFGQAQQQTPSFGTGNNVFGTNQTQASTNAFGQGSQTQGTGMFGQNQQGFGTGAVGGSANSIFGSNAQQGGNVFGTANTTSNNANVFGSQQNTGGNVFGSTQQGGNVFGAANTTGGNVFGAANTAGGNVFGPNTNTGGNMFGAANTQQGGNVFGAANNTAGGNSFGGFNTNNNNMNNKGVFGQGFLGNTSTPNTGGNVFGTNTNAGGNVFGTNNTNTGGNVFGNNNANTAGGNVFGNNPNTAGGNVFGGNTAGGNVFGAATNTAFGGATNTAFGGANQQGSSIFGSNTNTNTNTNFAFGGAPNSLQTSQSFGNTTTTNTFNQSNSLFNKNTTQPFISTPSKNTTPFGNTTTPSQSFSFGNSQQQPQNTGFQSTNNNNTFGGTTWGVPTTPIALGGGMSGQGKPFTSLKPKNTKIDGKHLVKCITLLDQNNNFCKKELMIRYMSGDHSQQQQQQFFAGNNPLVGNSNSSGFGNNNTTGNNLNFSFNAGTNTNAFNQQQKSPQQQSNLFTAIGNAFGGQQPSFGGVTQTPATGNLFGTSTSQTTGGTGIFGNNQPTTGGTLAFGANNTFGNQQPTTGGGFLNNANTSFKPAGTSSIFGTSTATPTTPAFGNTQQTGGFSLALGTPTTQQQPSGGLFASNTTPNQNTGTSFLSNNNTSTGGGGGLFGNLGQNAAQSTQPAQQSPSFGGGNLFGNTAQTQNNNSFSFGASQPAATGGGLFGQQTQPQASSGLLFGGQFANAQSANQFSSAPAQAPIQGYYQTPSLFSNMPQNPPPTLFGPQPQNSQIQSIEASANILSQLFNTDFFKKLIVPQNSPFDELRKSIQGKNLQDPKHNTLLKQYQDDFSDKRISRFNQDSRTVYNSSFNAQNTDGYLYGNSYKQPTPFVSITSRKNYYSVDQTVPPIPKRESLLKPAAKQQKQAAPQVRNFRKQKILAKQEQLPVLDNDYTISPSLDQLKKKTSEQLKKVPNVIIQNQYGKVVFKAPINLYNKKISDCVKIQRNVIDIAEPEWEDKKCQLHFYNFGGYADLTNEQEKNKLETKMKKWLQKNQLKECGFDKITGNLQAQAN